MSEPHSTAPAGDGKPAKPSKPSPDFPLFAHAAGVWAKKIRGKMHYFDPWDDPDAALTKYRERKDALRAGRKPRPATEGATGKELANQFLAQKQALVDVGELSPLTWGDYKPACDEFVGAFGKGRLLTDLDPDDFAQLRDQLARKWGQQRLGKTIQFIRCAFKHAFEVGLFPPVPQLRHALIARRHALQACNAAGILNPRMEEFVVIPWADECGRPQNLSGRWHTPTQPDS